MKQVDWWDFWVLPSMFLRDGIFTPFERYLLTGKSFAWPTSRLEIIPDHIKSLGQDDPLQVNSEMPWQRIQAIKSQVEQDFNFCQAGRFSKLSALLLTQADVWPQSEVIYQVQLVQHLSSGYYKLNKFDWFETPVYIIGQPAATLAECIKLNKIQIDRVVHLDDRDGPIILFPGVKLRGHSWLSGPSVVHSGSQLDNLRLENAIIGRACRLGGEISSSIFGNFSNKHHEGFVGHSLIGDWVNLGALTTTSDLKNNYGKIRLTHPRYSQKPVDSGLIKIGSILGDFVKTSIGTMLNTGSTVAMGTILTERDIRQTVTAFQFGNKPYRSDRFMEDAQKIAARRDMSIDPQVLQLLI